MTLNNKKANAARVRQREESINQIADNDDNAPAKPIVRATAEPKKSARVGITLPPISAMIGPFEKAGGSSAAVREAKLALLRVQAHQTMERTDASARKVEEALVPFAEARDTITPGTGG